VSVAGARERVGWCRFAYDRTPIATSGAARRRSIILKRVLYELTRRKSHPTSAPSTDPASGGRGTSVVTLRLADKLNIDQVAALASGSATDISETRRSPA
jgi:hypothetical protein